MKNLTMNNYPFIISTLKDHPNFYEDVIKLIEKEFHYESNNHFEIDFALLMNKNNHANCFIMIDPEKNKLIGHTGFCKRFFCKKNITLSAILIGGIVTHEEYRGKKIFNTLFEKIISLNQDAGLFILWSDIEGLYEKYSFTRAGAILETGDRDISLFDMTSEFEKTQFNLISDQDFEQIIKLHHDHFLSSHFSLQRDRAHWEVIRKISSIDLYLERSNEKIKSYFCVGKGQDLKEVIYEFASTDSKTLIKKISPFKLWLNEHNSSQFPNSELQYLAFIRIGNIETLNHFLKSISSNQLEINSSSNDKLFFEFKEKEYEASSADFIQYLFGPAPLEEFKEFELYPFISGCDSI
jgi:predicted GNAT family N-acyltransferase